MEEFKEFINPENFEVKKYTINGISEYSNPNVPHGIINVYCDELTGGLVLSDEMVKKFGIKEMLKPGTKIIVDISKEDGKIKNIKIAQ